MFARVLTASFFSPLFFQVIFDKVLVQRGLTTLDVLADCVAEESLGPDFR